ncbi:MAG TPA: UDP-N-acetylmuramoyl-tripeptide--D-alanyl-D-alanine ligase, partial [Armatimonadota bacterium]|nr:UDP-N-acetylmuramoyl-tripeptide--D-alanyl-D-alanine ligase [Armatimonadota bacterium]
MRATGLAAVAEALGVDCPSEASGARVMGVVHDTRLIEGGELFFALPGEQADGHSFIGEAFARGAVAAVSNRPSEARGPVLMVRDPLQALGRLCRWYRSSLRAQTVAITGSVGKTTTREMLGRICMRCGPTVVAQGNLNTEVGVPLTVFRADDATEYLVLEFAMRGPGQIAWLADAARPRVGAITNIDAVHAELLGTVEAIAEAKAELLAALPRDGAAALPADDVYFGFLRPRALCPVMSFGLSRGDVRARIASEDASSGRSTVAVTTPEGSADIKLRCIGPHYAYDAACAAAAGLCMGLPLSAIAEGLEGYAPGRGRGEVCVSARGVRVFDDAYNASPRSVKAALYVLSVQPARRVAVLGDMLEMGDAEETGHRAVGAYAAELSIDRLVAVGSRARWIADEAVSRGMSPEHVHHFMNNDDAATFLLGV